MANELHAVKLHMRAHCSGTKNLHNASVHYLSFVIFFLTFFPHIDINFADYKLLTFNNKFVFLPPTGIKSCHKKNNAFLNYLIDTYMNHLFVIVFCKYHSCHLLVFYVTVYATKMTALLTSN